MKTLLVTGTDTDVGKTWISCLVLRQLRAQSLRAAAYKPVCSGAITTADGQSTWYDVSALTEACGWTGPQDRICPQTFQAAVAPNVAAALEGRSVDDALLTNGLETWKDDADYLLVEGAGGLLSPISNSSTTADLASKLGVPIVIVAANRLGMINHTLLTVEVARNRGINVAAVVVNDASPNPDDCSRQSNRQQLQQWLPDINILSCQHGATVLNSIDSAETFAAHTLFDS